MSLISLILLGCIALALKLPIQTRLNISVVVHLRWSQQVWNWNFLLNSSIFIENKDEKLVQIQNENAQLAAQLTEVNQRYLALMEVRTIISLYF